MISIKDNDTPVNREWLISKILDFCKSDLNTLELGGEPAWAEPLIGFAGGDDSLFLKIREDIGEFYWTPETAFKEVYPVGNPASLTVISWILPQTDATRQDNRGETRYPSERWVRSRIYGEEFNFALQNYMVELLAGEGINAVAPVQLPNCKRCISERFGRSACWSERHAAHVAGLGTFGLCDGLITPVGKAMRCGSVIAELDISPSPRKYSGYHDYCLYFTRGTCGACMRRCPAGAISANGHDKELCASYIADNTIEYAKQHWGIDGYGCGLCQVKVPCESSIPPACRS